MDWIRYHIDPTSWKLPVRWEEVFGRDGDIWVEIGFGNGEFLLHNALKHPEVNFVGFELSITSLVKAQKKFHKAGVENVRLVMVDGRFGLRELFSDETVDRLYVNFPCPWSKKKHANRRITHGDFVKTAAAVLKKGGIFELMTDDKPYAEEVYETFSSSGYFEVKPIVEDLKRDVQTRYERKWLSMGRHTYDVKAKKISKATVKRISWGGEDVHKRVDEIDLKVLKSMSGKVYKSGKKVFVIKGVYSSNDDRDHVLKVIASDGDFEQHYNVAVEFRRNFWVVKLDSTCQPYRTPSVKWSVIKISDEIGLT